MNLLFSLAAGLIFGLGLVVSGMANPAKVQGFLDLAGAWDPSLAWVMCGAIVIAFGAFALARKRTSSLLGLPMQLPTAQRIDRRLIGGNLTFGIGWGLAGICPGPAIVLVGAGAAQGLIFVAAMLAGMGLVEFLRRSAP
jgi:uncharacterized membrane protein YedE/YeeE